MTSFLNSIPKPQLLTNILIVTLIILNALGLPVRAQVPPGATEVWPTDSLVTIQTAVDAGKVVYFHSGTYSWTGILNVNNSVELIGPEPIGQFKPKQGIDNRVWEAKIRKSPITIWGPPQDPIIQINCPGNTEKVIIRNLDIECLSLGMCVLLEGGGDSVEITKCRMKTVDDGYGFVSWLAGDVSVVIEDCFVEAGTEGFLYPGSIPPNTDCIVFGTSAHKTIEVKNNIAINHCDTLDVSTAIECVWNTNPNTQATISNNWLKSSGEGYTIFSYLSLHSIGSVRDNTIIGNYNILHMFSGSGGTIKGNEFECNGGGSVSFYFMDISDVTVQGNKFTGSVLLAGIALDGNSSGNVFTGNNISKLNVPEGAATYFFFPGTSENVVVGQTAGIQYVVDLGTNNTFTGSGFTGLGPDAAQQLADAMNQLNQNIADNTP